MLRHIEISKSFVYEKANRVPDKIPYALLRVNHEPGSHLHNTRIPPFISKFLFALLRKIVYKLRLLLKLCSKYNLQRYTRVCE